MDLITQTEQTLRTFFDRTFKDIDCTITDRNLALQVVSDKLAVLYSIYVDDYRIDDYAFFPYLNRAINTPIAIGDCSTNDIIEYLILATMNAIRQDYNAYAEQEFATYTPCY